MSPKKVQTYAKRYLMEVRSHHDALPQRESSSFVDSIKGLAGSIGLTNSEVQTSSGAKKDDNLASHIDLKFIDHFESKITGKHVYRYQQVYKAEGWEIPIYGSSVVVEAKGSKLQISSSEVDKITFREKEETLPSVLIQPNLEKESDLKQYLSGDPNNLGCWIKDINLNPTLYYYYYEHSEHLKDSYSAEWRLVWVTNVSSEEFEKVQGKDFPDMLSKLADYIVDANTGEIIAALPRYRTFR